MHVFKLSYLSSSPREFFPVNEGIRSSSFGDGGDNSVGNDLEVFGGKDNTEAKEEEEEAFRDRASQQSPSSSSVELRATVSNNLGKAKAEVLNLWVNTTCVR